MYSYGGPNARTYAEYNGDVDNPHFTFYDGASGASQYESAGLTIDKKGIDNMALTVKHEKTHHWGVAIKWKQPDGEWANMEDTDLPERDWIPDQVEEAHAYLGLNPGTPSSFTPPFWLGNDQEFWCEWKARNAVGDASQDWANPGKQSKNTY
ncbi:hypothetical protein FJZ53_07475 [Candidatus Woesearchaeota archaeon]|nr:hypothetical protein [Candidatus Woesearchaeota archaeon]